tara:strand:- start:824 stop:1264 length:441 start_codon:yes stop_codon:yes gene_type:complete
MLTRPSGEYYTLSELSVRAEVSIDRLRKLCREKKLASTRVGGIQGPHLVDKEIGDKFIKESQEKPTVKKKTKKTEKTTTKQSVPATLEYPKWLQESQPAKMDKITDMALTSLEMRLEQLEEQVAYCKYFCPHSRGKDKFNLMRDES